MLSIARSVVVAIVVVSCGCTREPSWDSLRQRDRIHEPFREPFRAGRLWYIDGMMLASDDENCGWELAISWIGYNTIGVANLKNKECVCLSTKHTDQKAFVLRIARDRCSWHIVDADDAEGTAERGVDKPGFRFSVYMEGNHTVRLARHDPVTGRTVEVMCIADGPERVALREFRDTRGLYRAVEELDAPEKLQIEGIWNSAQRMLKVKGNITDCRPR